MEVNLHIPLLLISQILFQHLIKIVEYQNRNKILHYLKTRKIEQLHGEQGVIEVQIIKLCILK